MKIYHTAADLVGRTPLLEMGRIEKSYGLEAVLLAKLEYLNPAGASRIESLRR